MLRSFLVSATLEGLEPLMRPPRRPVPVVWFARDRRLCGLVSELAAEASFPPLRPADGPASSTAAAGGGWRAVLLGDGTTTASRTVG